ncbi:MAG TPA: ABC transporter permease [Vicinamibacterales bacterium]|nr:ABC transporter permease [Vicinamibacterales bacterium]
MQDIRYAIRTLARSPGFAGVAVLTFALGIGANSAIFSFVDGVLLKPLPYPDPDRLVLVWEKPPGGGINVISALNFLDWRQQNDAFASIAAVAGGSVTLNGMGEPRRIPGARVSAAYFDVFGVKAAIGRTFAPDEEQPGKEHVVVLSHRLWANEFGGDPALVGRTLTLNAEPFTVIGVLPEGSPFDRTFNRLWRPLAFTPGERTRNFHWLQAAARLKPGVTLEQARARMDAIGARIATDYPDSNKNWGVSVVSYAGSVAGPQLKSSLYVLLASVGLLMLIGCANLANLTLARGTAREREVAVRAALGASRARLLRQFLTENVLLAVVGGAAGVALGYGLMRGLQLLLPPFYLPAVASIAMDVRVLAFALVLSVATGLLFGIVPALHATSPDLSSAMKEGGRGSAGEGGRRRLRSALVVAEVGLAFVLLAGGGLLIRSFFAMVNTPLGFDATNVLTLRVPFANDRFPTAEQITAYVREVTDRIRGVPGVRDVAATDTLPLEGYSNGMPFQIAGRDVVDRANRQACGFKAVEFTYFRTLGIQIVKGRPFTERDVKAAPPVAVINQSMADRYFPGVEPVGQRLLIQEIVPGKPQLGPEIPWEIVGVIGDERTAPLEFTMRPGVYVPIAQSPTTSVSLVVRGAMQPDALGRAITQAIHEVDRDQAVTDIRTLERMKSESAASSRLRTTLVVVFAALALLLSAVGVYGVLSYTVAQRAHEIGVRAALGASSGALTRMVLAGGVGLTAIGLAVGLAGALAVTRLLSTLLVGVGARDPLTLAAAAVVLFAVALVACYLPARRAASLDPLVVLRDA